MNRKIKALGIAIVASLALSAVAASAASAVTFQSSASPTTLSGTQVATNEFIVPGAGTVTCTGANFTGTVTGTSVTNVTVHPEYSGCKAFGFATTHVITKNGAGTLSCDYKFDNLGGTSPTFTGDVNVLCSEGFNISITPTVFGASACTITVGAQKPAGGVDFKNENTEKEVLVTSTATSISHSAGCGAEAKADGTYKGSVLEKGSNSIFVT